MGIGNDTNRIIWKDVYMNKLILRAYLTSKNTDTLKIPDLGLEVSGKQTVAPMCRLVMDRFPEYADYSLEVYRDEVLSLMAVNIASMAKKTFKEDVTGIHLVKFRPLTHSFKSA